MMFEDIISYNYTFVNLVEVLQKAVKICTAIQYMTYF